jgi:flagellar protein FlaI
MVLDKIKDMRGALYRKFKEKETTKKDLKGIIDTKEKDLELPGFSVKKTKHIVEFPEVEDPTSINVTYSLMEPFVYVNIKWDKDKKRVMYNVIEPKLSEDEEKMLVQISEAMIELIDVKLSAIKERGKALKYLEKNVVKVIKEFGIKLTRNQYVKMMYYIYRNFIGFNEINALLDDPHIEDISCDGVNTPIYIIHRKVGSIKTNIGFKDINYLREFIIKLAERCGRYVSYAEPILDGTLPDGSRVSATIAGDVATRGPTFTIRKFSERPISPVEQLNFRTASSEMLAYYWYLVENGSSMLIVGGVATGKTSFLNSVCMFIPPEAKIVSIEDTRELRIPNEHWVPSLARSGFGIPMPTGEKYGGVSLFDLLKESFRQNPDYVIVGETRGKEAYVMFQGMSSGHPSMSTFHAGSIDTVVKRLTTPPIELSPILIESLNVITIMIHAREKGKSARRVKEVVEIVDVDPKTEEVKTNVVFRWDPITDEFEKVNESIMLERLVLAKGGTVEEAREEVARREQIIRWMYENDVKDYEEVTDIINLYYKEPQKVFEMMSKEVDIKKMEIGKKRKLLTAFKPSVEPKPAIVKPKPKVAPLTLSKDKDAKKTPIKKDVEKKTMRKIRERGVSSLSLLGFKFIKEK